MSSEPSPALAPQEPPDDAVISVRGVGKCYQVFESNASRLRQAVTGRRGGRDFWALSDVSFDVRRGESLGIIGRNGSGKSTLMQIIAGTLAPTTGEVRIRGRIAALLELGSGFNPHFTGRENAVLSGAILGVPRREMELRTPEIEEFADIGAFIDEPVSTYSSGMHARLAFAVSISLRPDILILDEILSVGDAAFQQKCIGRLHALLATGVTLLFVSHAADAVRSICQKGLLLSDGRRQFFGPSFEAVDRYFRLVREQQTARGLKKHESLVALPAEPAPVDPTSPPAAAPPEAESDPGARRYGSGHARFESVRLLDDDGRPTDGFMFGEGVNVELVCRSEADLEKMDAIVRVRDRAGIDLFGLSANEEGPKITGIKAGQIIRVRFRFVNTLKAGPHGVSVTLTRPPHRLGDGLITLDHIDAAAAFESLPSGDRLIRGKVQLPGQVEWTRVEEPAPL